MSSFHSSEVVEALSLLGNVHNCNMINGDDPTVGEHYDCIEDLKKARDIINNILDDEGEK